MPGVEEQSYLAIIPKNPISWSTEHVLLCAIHENKSQEILSHKCFRTSNSSSASMEANIICEGFLLSEVQHGIRYMFVVGNGDSSVMANIRSSVPYGIFITKIKCANHACKSYVTGSTKKAHLVIIY